jgi:hypothetical protein
MSGDFLDELKQKIKTTLFTEEDLKLILTGKTATQIHNSLSYHLKKGHLNKHKRGLYSFVDKRGEAFSKFNMANILYSPSFVSFESALSHWGLIPEAVHEITSACFLQKKKLYQITDGVFSYEYSPVSPFFLDVEKDDLTRALMARPIRALFDLIYIRRKSYVSLDDLVSDLRLDINELKKYMVRYEASEILCLGEQYKKKSTIKLADILVRGFK